MDILKEIRNVMELEERTIHLLREGVGPDYEKVIRLLLDCEGKVVFVGIGKSGLIAQKIASTMVSTGTPAIFLHPTEAMHGDIGILKRSDVIIAISKSGESDELTALMPTIRRVGAKLISITAKATSTLACHSDLVLLTPIEDEACPLNMAPTCSTTAALVVGDALAMTVMKLKKFQPEDFAQAHPGGQLGKRLLLTIADLMRSGTTNPIVPLSGTTRDMLCEITSKRAGAVTIVDEANHLLGLVTDYDIRRVLEQGGDILTMSISDIMNKTPTFIYSDDKAFHALEIMENRENPFLVLPVLDRQDVVVGMIHLHDLVAKGL